MYIHACHTHIYNWSTMSCCSYIAVLNDCKSEAMVYTVLACSFRLVSTTHYISKATPTNDSDYSCHTRAIELV